MSLIHFDPDFVVCELAAHSFSSMLDFFVGKKGKKQIIVREGGTLLYAPIMVDSSVDLEIVLDGEGATVICSGL